MNTRIDAPKYVFGPVPSRRLGRSLGVDLVPFKTCTYDCIYCQLGRTICRTVERKEWVPLDGVMDELKHRLKTKPNYITLSGSGEPTLYSRLDELIDAIHRLSNIPVAVLTNGSLLWQPEVRAQLRNADVVLPSLDAPDPSRFAFINRPHPAITFERLVSGLKSFRQEFSGKYWLEVMLLGGYTALSVPVRQLAQIVRDIQPDQVQLNTAVRPPAEEYALSVSPERLKSLARLFKPAARVIADFLVHRIHLGPQPSTQAVINLLRRRPCTVQDVARGLTMKPAEAVKLLTGLEDQGCVQASRHGSDYFYRPAASGKPFESRQSHPKRGRPLLVPALQSAALVIHPADGSARKSKRP
jgi:wyosine [tRNA(Phe)-imidazoG37] synthetase (radical SAM superfamily)